MITRAADANGRVQLQIEGQDRTYTFFIKVTAHTPYCHLCRKRVSVVAEVAPGNPGNPRHVCKDCAKALQKGFVVVEDEYAPG